ncbi:DUF2164 domain-containing protein [Vibrio sonorensis]|uniref:DUF2164 domain-containing protein n=1 Tax=Vibrio sonorensis TaxID=1004316 RepID=UPI0008DA6627|nr:DUF2164 domain-containing protein [Vibrio sonorensis]
MSEIELTKQQVAQMAAKLQDHLCDEHEVELGQFDAEFLLEFIIKEFGPSIYNQGIKDAELLIHRKFSDLQDELYQVERDDKYK